MPQMKLKHLWSNLENVKVFDKPNDMLEQYPTTPQIAAEFMHSIESEYDAIEDKRVADLGCGCGVLSIAAVMLGCGSCLSIDIDDSALEVCRTNLDKYEISNVDLLQMDVTAMDMSTNSPWKGCVDTVVMNPPFGTQHNEGIDLKFVAAGLHMASEAVYSFHKTSTRSGIEKKATRDFGVDVEVVAEVHFNVPKMYKFHKKKSKDIAVDCIRFSHRNNVDRDPS